jgi:hypothetical protein
MGVAHHEQDPIAAGRAVGTMCVALYRAQAAIRWWETAASLRESAFRIAASVALLILHGDPRLGEPLRDAWVRCLQSPAWKACRAKHPDYIGRYDEEAPFNMLGARGLAQYFRLYFLPELPGADETEKLNAVFTYMVALVHACGRDRGRSWPESTGPIDQGPVWPPGYYAGPTGWNL